MKNKFNGYLYHIVRVNPFSLGNKFLVGESDNYFAKKLKALSFEINNKDLNLMLLENNIDDLSSESKKLVKNYVYESCMIIRELVLENVRLKEFSDCPSRLKCLYCAKSYKEAFNWVPILKRMDKKNPPLQIVKLKCKGKIFEGDGSLMLRDTFSVDCKVKMARKYWKNETSSCSQEILFVGEAEVVEVTNL